MLYEQIASTQVLGMSLLQLDNTFFFQLAIFLLLMFVLDRLLFRPALAAMRLRTERIEGRRNEASQLRREADELTARYQATLEAARQEAAGLKAELVTLGRNQEQQLLTSVRQAVRQEVEQADRQRERALDEARRQIPAQVEVLAREVTRRVLRAPGVRSSLLPLLGLLVLLFGAELPLAHAAAGEGVAAPQVEAAEAQSGHAATADHGEGCLLKNESVQLGGWLFNFLLLLWLLRRFGARPVQQLLVERRVRLVADLAEAARLREEAVDLLALARSRIEQLESERVRLLADFRKEGELECERLIAEAERQAERIRRDTSAALQQESARAVSRIQVELVEQAVARAEEQLRTQLTVEEDGRQVDEFLRLLAGPSPEPGPPGAAAAKGTP